MSMYDTRTMLEALKTTPPIFTFLHDTFFSQSILMRTEKAEVDIVRGGVKASVFVAPRVKGILETRKGFETYEITTPRLAPERVLTGEDLAKRQPGENVYTVHSPKEIAARIMMQDYIEMRRENTLAREWLCAKIFQGEAMDIPQYDERGNKAGIFNVDFGFRNNIKSKTKWTDANANPIADIEDWIEDKLMGKTSSIPAVVVLDPEAGKAFANNPKVCEVLERRAIAGSLQEPTYKGTGVTSFGRFTKYNIEVVTYSNIIMFSEEESGQVLGKGTAIISPVKPGLTAYGAITQKEKGVWRTYMAEEVPKYVIDDKNEVDVERLTSRPLPLLKDIDSVLVAKGLV